MLLCLFGRKGIGSSEPKYIGLKKRDFTNDEFDTEIEIFKDTQELVC
jgi:hypothetical protein